MAFPNKYPSLCATCRKPVAVKDGLCQKVSGKWTTYCKVCSTLLNIVEIATAVLTDTRRMLEADGTLRIPYSDDENQKALLRSMPVAAGRRSGWDAERKVWVASIADADIVRTVEIAKKLGLEIAPELVQRSLHQTVEAAAAAGIPGLYDYQVTGVQFLSSGDRCRLLADDQGTGKTIQTLCALPREGVLPPVLVVVPAVVKYNWQNEAAKWAPMYKTAVLSGRGSFRWPVAGEIVMINYDILPLESAVPSKPRGAKILKCEVESYGKALAAHESFKQTAPAGLVVVVDECHNARNKSGRTAKITGLVALATRAWGLTGTPLLNRPDQLWRVLSALGCAQTVFGSWNKFTQLYHATPKRWGGYDWGHPAAEVPERLRRVMLRRTKAEVLPQLPPKRYQSLVINGLDKTIKAELDRLWEEYRELLEDETTAELPPFSEFSTIRAMLSEARLDAAVEWVEAYEDAGEPVVVMSAHRAVIDALGEREGWETITGDVSAEKRTQIVARFQAGELKGVACTIAAAGVGLTLTKASVMLFVDLDWTPALNIQAQDRIHRIGQTAQSVQYVRMVSDHPLDIHVNKLIAKKMDMIERSIERLVKVDVAAITNAAKTEQERWDIAQKAAREAEKNEAREKCSAITIKQRAKLGEEAPMLPLTPARLDAIKSALETMLGVCDGAELRDGVGFNKPDAMRSRWLSHLGLEDVAAQQCALAMLQGYRRQLGQKFPDPLEGDQLMSITVTTDTAIERIRKIYPECANITIVETFMPKRGWMKVPEEGGYGIKQIGWLRDTGITAVQLRLIDRHNAVRHPDFQMFEFEVEKNFEVHNALTVHVNQGGRDALVVAVLENEALIEYEMPAGTSSLLIIKRDAYPKIEVIRNINYNLPKKWIKAIVEGRLGLHNLIWNPQAGKHSAQKSFERAEKIAQEIETLEKETVK